MKQLYLIHGSDAKWVTRQREALVDELVPRDMRDENLLDLYSGSSRMLELGDILPEILSELAMIPFLPDSRRVVVVHNVAEVFRGSGASPRSTARKGGKKGKGAPPEPRKLTPVEALAAFVNTDLPATENVLIFSNIVEYDRGLEVDDKAELYLLIAKSPLGEIIKPDYRETNPIFLMSDALLARDTAACLRHFRAIYRDDARGRVFHELLRVVRLLLQAIVIDRIERKGMARDMIEMKYLPNDKRLNFYQQADYPKRKIKEAMGRFTLRELMRAMERLLEINRRLYPEKNATYVPDIDLLLETFIVEFCERARKAA